MRIITAVIIALATACATSPQPASDDQSDCPSAPLPVVVGIPAVNQQATLYCVDGSGALVAQGIAIVNPAQGGGVIPLSISIELSPVCATPVSLVMMIENVESGSGSGS